MRFLRRCLALGKLKKRITLLLAVLFFLSFENVFADSVTTSVTVGNTAPSITSGPAESPASTSVNPTNVGTNVTFTVTAEDSNGESYYLAVCTTDEVTAVNGGAPTCDTGTWCVSTSTISEDPASCTYEALDGDVESNAWYAFVCDGNSSAAACTATGNQGTGDSGSPFNVNHAPEFPTASNDSAKNPGQDLTWSTSIGADDTDTDDTVKLIVCKTAGISAGDCDGGASDRWCASSLVANDPSCAYSIPNPTPDGANDAWVYLVDNHNFASDGVAHGTESDFTVNNVAPVVSSVTLNGGSPITLTESTTTAVNLTATVTDNNSCTDLSSVVASLYRSDIGYAGCDIVGEADDNHCYPVISCSVSGGNTCDGVADASASYACSVNVQYHADPTDANTTYSAQNWLDTILATDDDTATHSLEVTTGVEMNSLEAYDMSESIGYGSLGAGESNDPLDKTTTLTATGNVGLDQEVSGSDMDDGNEHYILVEQQEYALVTDTAYGNGTDLTDQVAELEINCLKTVASGSPKTKNTWWGLLVPEGTIAGTYTGSNTIAGVKGEYAEWY
jgi:hypothetical protein